MALILTQLFSASHARPVEMPETLDVLGMFRFYACPKKLSRTILNFSIRHLNNACFSFLQDKKQGFTLHLHTDFNQRRMIYLRFFVPAMNSDSDFRAD